MKALKSVFKASIFSVLFILTINFMAYSSELSNFKIAVMKFGTVLWELETIKNYELDKKHNFNLEIIKLAGNTATRVAFQAKEADAIVADWIWVAVQRNKGKDYVFSPYSKAIGELLVPKNSEIVSLKDLKGKTIGIAGGPLDKSWIIFQAYTKSKLGFDIKKSTNQIFGAPPLIFKKALSNEIDAVINYWHYIAKLKSRGMRSIISVADTASELGLDKENPMLGYVFDLSLPKSVSKMKKFISASNDAKIILGNEKKSWERIKPLMKVKSESDFEGLINGFRAGIPNAPIDVAGITKMFNLINQSGGSKLFGGIKELPKGLFVDEKK